jgi:hypothetical protein
MTFYSYMWLRENQTPYYVGKGSGRRAFSRHERVNPPKQRERIIIFPMASEQMAFESEMALIELFRRKIDGGFLHNVTLGGDQPPSRKGIKTSDQTRQKMSHSHKEKATDPAVKERLAATSRAIPIESRKRQGQFMLGKQHALGYCHTEEAKRTISRKMRSLRSAQKGQKELPL